MPPPPGGPYHPSMPVIQLVNSEPTLADARTLFSEYGKFLGATQACGYFSHPDFEREIATLPAPYTDHAGQILLRYVQGAAAACIAYRKNVLEGPATCEIKRLYVRPSYRGHGLARQLVADVLLRAGASNYNRIILDTDLAHMPGAFDLYTCFGFKEFGTRRGSIAFFELPLIPATPAH